MRITHAWLSVALGIRRAWLSVALLALWSFTNISQSAIISYDGHRVYSLIPQDEVQLQGIAFFLETHPQLDVWREPHGVEAPIHVALPVGVSPNVFKELEYLGVPIELHISDVQKEINIHRLLNEQARKKQETMFESFHNFSEIMSWLEDKALLCGDKCGVQTIGSSYEGRPLKLIKIGKASDEHKDSIWVDAGIHAREWIAPATAMYFIERLINDYNTDDIVRNLVDTYDFYILPVVNPDGYEYTWSTNRTWRKTRSLQEAPQHCQGVDANRNFDFKWNSIGSSADPCSNTYAGPHPLSEPETKAQSDFMLSHQQPWRVFLTLHSYGQLWMAPWGYTTELPEDYDKMMRAASVAVDTLESVFGTKYTLGSAANILYESSGTSRDWAKGKAQIDYVYTAELRDKGNYAFLLPPEEIYPTARETWEGFKAMLKYIQTQG